MYKLRLSLKLKINGELNSGTYKLVKSGIRKSNSP